jgi:hypothetical protein
MNNENGYVDYPFTANGINFVSRVFLDSPNIPIIDRLPQGVFESMNADAISELIGDVSLLTEAELVSELERLNEGGTHSFVLLESMVA